MHGRRIYPDPRGNMPLDAGQYGELDGAWWVRPPRGGVTLLATERVTEHEDGTISVAELLEFSKWRGFLSKGDWIEE